MTESAELWLLHQVVAILPRFTTIFRSGCQAVSGPDVMLLLWLHLSSAYLGRRVK